MKRPSRSAPAKVPSSAGSWEAAPENSGEPANPLARLTTAQAMVVAVVVLAAMMGLSYVMFKPHFDNPQITLVEKPLAKNTEFQLNPGEEYVYGYIMNGTEANVTYEILDGNNCTIIALMDTNPPATSCVDRWGMDTRGYNSQLENSQVILFQPWMLALSEGWKWNTSMYMGFENETHYMAGMDYRVMRTDTWHGRAAFVVAEATEGSEPQYEWVDAEKRILLRMQGDGYEVDLLQGLPFDDTNGTSN
jgi:hypothetical protein